MVQNAILPVSLPLWLGLGRVNCYLVRTDQGFILIDTGISSNRRELAHRLEAAGCRPGLLTLILLTHGDYDHTGNAAYLRRAFGGQIAMHRDDAGMAELGDMFVNRRPRGWLVHKLIPLLVGLARSDLFTPDLLLADGDDLSPYGWEARVISIPGHSKGSIGVLTAGGDLFCGDLLVSTSGPALNSLIDDMPAAVASVEMLKRLVTGTVYPGHGPPFPMKQIS